MKRDTFLWVWGFFLLLASLSAAGDPVLSGWSSPTELTSILSTQSKHPSLKELLRLKTHVDVDFYGAQSVVYDSNHNISSLLSATKSPPPVLTPYENVTSISISVSEEVGNWTLVEKLFSNLPKLEYIYWQGEKAISPAVLGVIEQTALSAKLFYTIKTYAGEMSKPHRAIISSTVLYSIEAIIDYGYPKDNVTMPLILSAIESCPNLKELSIKISENSCDASLSSHAFDFASKPNMTLNPLEVLRMDGYNFNSLEDGSSDWHAKRALQDYASRKPDRHLAVNLELWKKAMDFSKLQTLELNGPDERILSSFGGNTLPSLRHLSLTDWYGWEGQMTMDFVRDLQAPLESFDIKYTELTFNTVVGNITKYHCPTLRSFKFGDQIETPSPELDSLLEQCPRLEILDITVRWPNTTSTPEPTPIPDQETRQETPLWDPYLLDIPRKAQGTRRLVIRFPSPPDEADFQPAADGSEYRGSVIARMEARSRRDGLLDTLDNVVNKNTTLGLFRALRKSETEGPLREGEIVGLERLEVYMGDWENRNAAWGGFMGRGDRIRVAFYECFLDDSGNEKCEGSQTRSVNYGGDHMEYLS